MKLLKVGKTKGRAFIAETMRYRIKGETRSIKTINFKYRDKGRLVKVKRSLN